MKTFETKWWTVRVPDGTSISSCRDYVSIKMPDEPDSEIRLTVLRGEHSDTTLEDLETYASSFYDGMQDRIPINRNGWTGFVFVHVDTTSKQASCRGYFGKGRYLLIATVNDGIIKTNHEILGKMLEQLEVKIGDCQGLTLPNGSQRPR